jgi:dolichol kinase
VEGTIGFAAGAMGAFMVLPIAGTLAIVLLSSIIESLPLKVNDNIVLPVAASLMYYLVL